MPAETLTLLDDVPKRAFDWSEPLIAFAYLKNKLAAARCVVVRMTNGKCVRRAHLR